jgi:hypothetical protein
LRTASSKDPRSPLLVRLPLLLLLPCPSSSTQTTRRARPLPPKPKDRHFDRSCSRLCEQRSGEIRFSTSTVRQPPHRPPTSAFALLSDPRRRPAVVLVFQPRHLPGRAHLEGCAENPVTSRKSTPLGCAENPVTSQEGHTFRCAENKPGRRPTALPKAGAKPEGRSD